MNWIKLEEGLYCNLFVWNYHKSMWRIGVLGPGLWISFSKAFIEDYESTLCGVDFGWCPDLQIICSIVAEHFMFKCKVLRNGSIFKENKIVGYSKLNKYCMKIPIIWQLHLHMVYIIYIINLTTVSDGWRD